MILLLLWLSPPAAADDEHDIRAVFQQYRAALLDKDGQAAWRVTDSHTRQYYDAIAKDSVAMAREDLERLDLITRFTILRLRLELRKAHLLTLDGEKIFGLAVELGWISRSTVEQAELARVTSDGRTGSAYLAQQPDVPVFHFLNEDGGWKLALSQSFELFNQGLEAMATSKQITEDELVRALLAQVSKFGVDDRIYEGPLE